MSEFAHALPLEGTYLVLSVSSGLIGFFAMRWFGLRRTDAPFAVAGFLYVLARASFMSAVIVMLVRQVATFDTSGDWRSVGYGLLLVSLFVLMFLSNAVMLVARVYTNFYGPGRAPTTL